MPAPHPNERLIVPTTGDPWTPITPYWYDAITYNTSYYIFQQSNYNVGSWNNAQLVSETEEQYATRLAAEAKYAQEKAEAAARAEARAEAVLLAILNPEQAAQYKANGWFETEVNDSTYRIHRARSMNVERVVEGKPTHKYCAHPGDMTPDEDVMLAQLLMLQTDEARFLSTANVRVLG